MNITILDLAQAIGADIMTCVSDAEMRTVSKPLIDSRSLVSPEGTVFFALTGDSNDGHKYIQDLYDRGVRVFVVSHIPDNLDVDEGIFLIVANGDIEGALLESASLVRERIHIPVIAVAGSRGKTVAKELIAAAIGAEQKVYRSPRSWNSRLGVPLSLWHADNDAAAVIIEAGISESGEMARLERIIRPDVGVFTELTSEHADGFDSEQQKLDEKLSLFKNTRSVYFLEDAGIKDSLYRACPDSEVIAVDGGLRELAVDVAIDLGIKRKRAVKAVETANIVSARLDISAPSVNLCVASDNFTCDIDGIAVALDFLNRRIPASHRRIIALGEPWLNGGSMNELVSILRHYGFTNVIPLSDEVEQDIHRYAPDFEIVPMPEESDVESELHGSTIYITGNDREAVDELRDTLSLSRHLTVMDIDLEALAHNYRYYKGLLPSETGIVAMIKASAYGCGDIEVARTLQSLGAQYLAVAVVDEGIALRHAGLTMPILVLDPLCRNPRAIVTNNLEPTIIAPDSHLLQILDRAAARHRPTPLPIHLKLDTGMHRVGLTAEQIEPFVEDLANYPHLRVASIFSHLATADDPAQDDYTREQLEKFNAMTDVAIEHLGYSPLLHILNTAGISRFASEHHHDMARLGLGLYGISPLAGDTAPLKPVASLHSTIISLRELGPNDTVGYGRNGHLTRRSVIATLPVGYADGIDRHLGRGAVTFRVNGVDCPTVGNICMDLTMIDVTECPDIKVGTEVEIFGSENPIEQLAKARGTITYEVLTSISPRIKRRYFRD